MVPRRERDYLEEEKKICCFFCLLFLDVGLEVAEKGGCR